MINWLTSYPKSGNTWVRMLLNAYFDDGHLNINVMPWGAGDNRRFPYQAVSPIPIDQLSREDVVLLRSAALMNLVAALGQKPMLVKSHHCHGSINDITLFPARLTRRAFYMVRDPRDVAVSWANHAKISIDEAIDHMENEEHTIEEDEVFFHTVSSWSNHVNSWLSDKLFKVHLIKYEKLLDDPHKILYGILEAIGFEDIESDRIERAVKATEFERLKKQEQDNKFEEAPEGITFFQNGGSNWKNVLTSEQINRIESVHYETMERLGYRTTTLRSKKAG